MSFATTEEAKTYWTKFVDSSYIQDELSLQDVELARLNLFAVELSIALMKTLNLLEEPLETLPYLINWTAVNLDLLGVDNAQLLKRNSVRLRRVRSINAWTQTLAAYLNLPREICLYELPGITITDINRQLMQQINFQDMSLRDHIRREEYLVELIHRPLQRSVKHYSFPQQTGIYHTWVDGKTIEFDLQENDIADSHAYVENLPIIGTSRDRPVRDFRLVLPDDLISAAQRLGEPWPKLLNSINFRSVEAQGLAESNAYPLTLDTTHPFHHLVGMTGARKTVLATLIAAWAIEQYLTTGEMWRVVLVFSTVSEALRRADILNRAFRESLTQPPVAVPIFGESGRASQISRFFRSKDFRPEQEHWGERFLTSICLLQSRLTPSSRGALNLQALPPGMEPCEKLAYTTHPAMSYLCPFFGRCLSRRRYSDLEHAPVWIANPWSLAFTRVPLPFTRDNEALHSSYEQRILEIVAGNADLVIVDEADTVQATLDDIWGPTYRLYGGGSGLFDANITTVAIHDSTKRMESAGDPWVRSFIRGWEAINLVTAILTDARHGTALIQWVGRDFFTLEYLLLRLARRLAGVPEASYFELEQQQIVSNQFDELVSTLLEILRTVMGSTPVPDDEYSLLDAQRELLAIRRALISTTNHRNTRVQQMTIDWLNRWVLEAREDVPPYHERVDTISSILGWRSYEPEIPERLSAYLILTLGLSNLRHYTQIITELWDARPEISGFRADSLARSPNYADGLLPAPPLGQTFGFSIQRREALEGDDGIAIQAAEHRAIGRGALYNLPELREAVEGIDGPRVLTLSATSYMPDSARFHIHLPPSGILEPYPPRGSSLLEEHPVAQSTFVFVPILDADRSPIRISGVREKEDRLRLMARQMSIDFLPEVLQELEYRASKEPKLWSDRLRIVIFPNSYSQAQAMAIPLAMSRLFDRVFLLARENYQLPHNIEIVTLADVEQIGIETPNERVVFVAPLQAIGRGLNILNREDCAAFGAAIFATRYYPQPGDFGAVVDSIHAAIYSDNGPYDGSIYQNLRGVRNRIRQAKIAAEADKPYSRLTAHERRGLAADTTAIITQAAGRLVRGVPDMVPFLAYFTDAAWAPLSADGQVDTPETSLLLAMRDYMAEMVDSDPVFRAAHGPLFFAFEALKGVYYA